MIGSLSLIQYEYFLILYELKMDDIKIMENNANKCFKKKKKTINSLSFR